MRQYELISWAIRGLIEEKIQEQDEKRRIELEQNIKELSVLMILEKQKENEKTC